jgi:hypothetical protein
MQSTRGCGPCGPGGEPPLPSRDYLCLTLLQEGVAWPQTLPPAPVVSYTTFSPLPLPPPTSPKFLNLGEEWGLGRSVSVARSVRLPHPGCYPAPCSVECGLSSMAQSHRGHPVSLGIIIIPYIISCLPLLLVHCIKQLGLPPSCSKLGCYTHN